MNDKVYCEYLAILQEELVPALGCTEPIAIAYAAATARETLGCMPERLVVSCSGNIVKNVKAVIVPTTNNMKGIETSAVLGAVGGEADKKLEVLSGVTQAHLDLTRKLLADKICTVKLLEGVSGLQIIVEAYAGNDNALVEIAYAHTNIVRIERNGEVLFQKTDDATCDSEADRSLLNMRDIYEFACTVRIEDIKPLIDRQIDYNLAIAEEGLRNHYGAGVGMMLLKYYGDDVRTRAKALAAAGSDARMNGCVLPVVTNSGSGNQGMTASLPIVVFAQELHSDEEKRYRALVLSNLIAIYQKNFIGKLSAFCGAVSAATGAGAGIAYLYDADLKVIAQTVVNTMANVSGIVCDGAKSSCAAKIASSIDAALMAYYLASEGRGFHNGEGLVRETAEHTLRNYCRMGRDGMHSTDLEILKIMLEP